MNHTNPPDGRGVIEAELRVLHEEIELLEDEVELLEEEIEHRRHHEHRFHVRVDNQENGAVVRFLIGGHRTVGDAIEAAYTALHATRQNGDRLVRVSDGTDVFAAAAETIEDYVGDSKVQSALHWAYRGELGGAGA